LRGYLLDTNHIDPLFRREPGIVAKYNAVPQDWQIRVSTITLGEIEAGNLLADPPDAQRQDDLNRFLNDYFISSALCVEVATRVDYAELLARIIENHPRPSHNISLRKHLYQQGVDINDLWIVSIAREHGLTVCTDDSMAVIRAAAYDVAFDNWLIP
jgi:predicted nucleic acid-binding protein